MTAPFLTQSPADSPLPDASTQDGTYPRPMMMRATWADLSGTWDFAWGDLDNDRPETVDFDRRIEVPYPPESQASGIGDTGFHPCVWYRRTITAEDLAMAGFRADAGGLLLLHFGAIDHDATVWINGKVVASHIGGQTPFSADVTPHLLPGDNTVVVRAVDLPSDVSILRGKQDWKEDPHTIWYHRTTGIWQPVWLETVPSAFISATAWRCDVPSASVEVDVDLAGSVSAGELVTVALRYGAETLAESTVSALGESRITVRLVVPRQLNGQAYEELLWSPASPTLIDTRVSLWSGDAVAGYVGLRSVGVDHGVFLLNDRPERIRAVLAQNYWPDTLNSASAVTLRREVELILSLGFNAARIHQKAEDPRMLFWADRLGLMVWAETASAYAFDSRSMTALVAEWSDIVRRDSSHPCIVTWVPLNESWGVQHLSHDPRQRAFSRAIADLTRALDGTRPVISNDGWEHTASDIASIHDYESDPEVLRRRYGSRESVEQMLNGFGPAGRRMRAGDAGRQTPDAGFAARAPVMLTEFGGVSLATGNAGDWGYSTASDVGDFEKHVTDVIRAVASSDSLAGFCYTQLTDTGQETNGLLYADRTPKFAADVVRRAVLGLKADDAPG